MSIVPWKFLGESLRVDTDLVRKHWGFFSQFFPNRENPPSLHGKFLSVCSFERPDGKIVDDFAMLGEAPAAKKLAITKDNKVIAVRQYKQGAGICVEIPGGAIDHDGDSPEIAGSRELLEETGYKAAKVIPLGPAQYMTSRNSTTSTTSLWLALGCEKIQEGKIDAAEEIEVLLIPLSEWIEKCHQEIVDPFSIVATFRAIPHIK